MRICPFPWNSRIPAAFKATKMRQVGFITDPESEKIKERIINSPRRVNNLSEEFRDWKECNKTYIDFYFQREKAISVQPGVLNVSFIV